MQWWTLALSGLLIGTISGAHYTPDWKSIDSRPLPGWFDNVKVGIFLHWGVFSVPSYGSEWFWANWKGGAKGYAEFMEKNYKPGFSYQEFGPMFTAEFFEPDAWADLFKASGAGYVVLTSKHHEGFTLWPSSVSWNWNAKDIGPKRDLVGDLAKSIRNRTDIKFGLYHSMFDWFNPLYASDKANNYSTQSFVTAKAIPELHEIVTAYKPEVIWSDGDWEASDDYWTSRDFLAWLYNESPVKDTVVVNDRWGKDIPCHHGGYYTCQDRYNPGKLQPRKWENAMTMDKSSWGYRREASISDILKPEELMQTLIETIAYGGNLLVNVGPTHDGRIVPVFEERLRQMGAWLGVNGEAVYGTQPWPRAQNDSLTPGVWYTQRPDTASVYVFTTSWPRKNVLALGSLNAQPGDVITLLGTTGKLSWSKGSSGETLVTFPTLTPSAMPCQWAWALRVKHSPNSIYY